MKAGIIGLASSGKTTLTGAFTGKSRITGKGSDIAIAKVPDERLYELEKLYSPEKITPATIQIEDLPPLNTRIKEEKLKFFDKTKNLDVQILCIGGYRCYNTEEILKELATLRFELIINDLDVITKRLEKIEIELKKFPKMKPERESEIKLLNGIKTYLEEEKFPSLMDLDDNSKKLLKNNYNFFTLRLSIYVINISSEDYMNKRQAIEDEVRQYMASVGDSSPFLLMDALTEADIMDIDGEEIGEFLKVFGLKEPAKNKLIRKVYQLLGLITFFTVGEDEVRAWNIHRGDTAVSAAGAIHSDLARGFIRAEVVEADLLLKLGSLNTAKSQGKLRLEGKNYIVKDGDIVHILFNV
ncbi:MAG TPA: DUF933 domain-containing protein [Candidatus Eremiobacteraeota bacterium]|nr:MAG: Ribosome-binding ATPase YchF [bacterium ADurb.Bin363]HPZ08191.1 DUF933 domain-containing protein [Candidatus Eremiobacteraeota bacterium]